MNVESDDSLGDTPRLTYSLRDDDAYWFREGRHCRSYQFLGAACELHPVKTGDEEIRWVAGIRFRVWMPHAKRVRVAGSFNQWDGRRHEMHSAGETGSGFWELFIPELVSGVHYRYDVCRSSNDEWIRVEDPATQYRDTSMAGASRVLPESVHVWKDGAWLGRRAMSNTMTMGKPQSIYELSLTDLNEGYRSLADRLIARAVEQKSTHVLIPAPMEPNYFALSAREGCPDDLRFFINACHVANLGVIVDWKPCSVVTFLDQSVDCVYEGELSSLLLSSACYWLEEFHVDGLRTLVQDKSQAGINTSTLPLSRCLALLETVVHRDYPGVLLLGNVSNVVNTAE